jgi:hypothetical protein
MWKSGFFLPRRNQRKRTRQAEGRPSFFSDAERASAKIMRAHLGDYEIYEKQLKTKT